MAESRPMKKWIKVKHPQDLPRHGAHFLAIYKGRISLVEHDVEEDRFFLAYDPAGYEGVLKVAQGREHKITHWMSLPQEPKDQE